MQNCLKQIETNGGIIYYFVDVRMLFYSHWVLLVENVKSENEIVQNCVESDENM